MGPCLWPCRSGHTRPPGAAPSARPGPARPGPARPGAARRPGGPAPAPGLTCRYGDAPPYPLEVMRVRPAIAFAVAATQRIRRTLLVQYTDDLGADPTWSTWSTSDPVAKDAQKERMPCSRR